ncbi:galactosyltransferase-related protein [Stigmatella aurantiaca]|uniref:Glycosyl transferase, group 2 family protein n=1 Tax=Stigmatella aurantiaca (strain DW4/3-1) TaxID=378806 RepID=Q09C09_STIAD|nr:galactosyltransferase-related protein [Stigmatella aurantiaca]ADO74399.1 Glycosyl transferase, group 2 family protein [Stigmatella aurantiaca DW4/3-1]EAU69270.1 glycosyl transferase, group 2 family protein, putative [Stigmatella aurantiaca DW4/3-1]
MTRKQPPPLSIIIPWCRRPELDVTLRRNRRFFTAHPFEVLVVNCGGSVRTFRKLLRAHRFPGLRGLEMRDTSFNKSLALNAGASAARANCFLFLDADVVLRGDFLEGALAKLGTKHFVTVDRLFESHPAARRRSRLRELAYLMRFVDRKGRAAQVETQRVNLSDGSHGGPGLVMLRRKHFEEVNGMNSNLRGWGWEDMDLLVRLQLALGLSQRRHGEAVHLTHGDDQRDLGGIHKKASELLNLFRCLENYREGYYWGTRDADVETWQGRFSWYE